MRPGDTEEKTSFPEYKKPFISILVIRCNGVSDLRIDFAARYLDRAGYHVEMISRVPYYKLSQHDIFLASRPGPEMCDLLMQALDAGKKVVLDMDDDFFTIPKHNPSYTYVGAGNPNFHMLLKKLLKRVTLVLSTEEVRSRYGMGGEIIPNCFDEENFRWELPKDRSRGMRRIGLTGSNTHVNDFKLIQHVLLRLARERKDVQLVIGNDPAVYHLFDEVPEGQKLFIPSLTYQLYPYYFRYVDILAVPLEDTIFTRAKSDIKLVECGAARIPFVASPLPFYGAWSGVPCALSPGIICENEADKWYEALTFLIEDLEICKQMGDNGYKKAHAERTSAIIGKMWVNIIENMVNNG